MYGFGYRYSPKGIYVPSGGGGALDPDAEAFLTAATITDPTEISAVNQLVIDMKDAGIWTKMKAVYPFVGGTSTTHKWNLITPVDSDSAFRLTFFGGWTHSSTGALPNGTNGYAQTYFNIGTDFTNANRGSAGGYWRTVLPNINYFFGVNVPVLAVNSRFWIRSAGGTKDHHAGGGTLLRESSVTDYSGFSAMSRRASNDMFAIKRDGTYITLTTNVTTAFSNATLPLSAVNQSGSITGFHNSELAYMYLSDDLTQSEMTDLRTAVINFQTTLGRAV